MHDIEDLNDRIKEKEQYMNFHFKTIMEDCRIEAQKTEDRSFYTQCIKAAGINFQEAYTQWLYYRDLSVRNLHAGMLNQ